MSSQTTTAGKSSYVPSVELLEDRIALDTYSIGPNGIGVLSSKGDIVLLHQAQGGQKTTLDGSGIKLGQVEIGRPGQKGGIADRADLRNDNVEPKQVWTIDGPPVQNSTIILNHAMGVAGIMIDSGAGNGKASKGIAPKAELYSSGTRWAKHPDLESIHLRALQKIAQQGVVTINYSTHVSGDYDGTSLLTKGVDWIADEHIVLIVLSRGNGDTNLPADSFNTLKVGASTQVGGVFNRLWDDSSTEQYVEQQILTHLIAPGDKIRRAQMDNKYDTKKSGTSHAAPHATGTIALLHQYSGLAGFGNAGKNPLVTKAVLINSVDKMKDDGTVVPKGNLLGMTKTIVNFNGDGWLSNKNKARDEPGNVADGQKIPLNIGYGAGQLNAQRAITQFSSGKKSPAATTNEVPLVGWDYNTVGAEGQNDRSYLLKNVRGNSYVSVTLTWERVIEHTDTDSDGKYSKGDKFTAKPLDNLDIELIKKGVGENPDQVVWKSASTFDVVEHLFFKVTDAGDYEIKVVKKAVTGGRTEVDYGLAWWAVPKKEGKPGKIGDKIWKDQDKDGKQQSQSDPGVADVFVHLYQSDGTYVATTSTDSYGEYLFDDLDPGDYYIQVQSPAGYFFTDQDEGTDDYVDSDVDELGYSDVFTLAYGQYKDDVDVGLVPFGTVGDYVWSEVTANGIQDPGEEGVEDLVVTLYTDAGDFADETVTDSEGYYRFDTVVEGDYYVTFSPPPIYTFTTANVGSDDTVDSDADILGTTGSFFVGTEMNVTDVDAGLVPQSALIGDYVWEDVDGNGIQETGGELGIGDVVVTLYDSFGTNVGTTTTDVEGYYEFIVAPGDYYLTFTPPTGMSPTQQYAGGDPELDSDVDPFSGETPIFTVALGQVETSIDAGFITPVEIGDYVWEDLDGDGVQGSEEPGMDGVNVELYRNSDGTFVDSTTTDSTGWYELVVDPGEYYAVFYAPFGYEFTLADQGSDDGLDSDVLDASGMTGSFIVGSLGVDDTIDAGLVQENTAPIAFDDEYETVHDQALIESAPGVLLNDYDDDMNPIEVSWNSDPSYGSLTLNADGSFTYAPDAGYVGQDSFTYKVTDGFEESNVATVTIDVTNFTPIAFDDEYFTMEDTELIESAGTGLLSNDYDDDMDPLEVYTYSQPSNGSVTVNSDGSFTYVPDSGYSGLDSFTYDVTDGVAVSSIATVQIDVQPGMPLRASEPTTSQEGLDVLSWAELAPLVDEAIIRWTTAGAGASQVLSLQEAVVLIVDLPSNLLGFANGGAIWIDTDAAGHGWFVDATPGDDVEFNLAAPPPGLDLLSVVAHELGHVLGLPDLDPAANPNNLMAATLSPGVRRSPTDENLLSSGAVTAPASPPLSTEAPSQALEDDVAFAQMALATEHALTEAMGTWTPATDTPVVASGETEDESFNLEQLPGHADYPPAIFDEGGASVALDAVYRLFADFPLQPEDDGDALTWAAGEIEPLHVL